MNWIIRKSNKITAHSYLNEILLPLADDIKSYNWIFSDLQYSSISGFDTYPINLEQDYFILDYNDFKKVLNSNIQFYWGTILAVPTNIEIKLDSGNLPYSEGNPLICKDGNLQHPCAEIEIDCFDSGYTIVKFTNENLSKKFKAYFDEAIELEKFK